MNEKNLLILGMLGVAGLWLATDFNDDDDVEEYKENYSAPPPVPHRSVEHFSCGGYSNVSSQQEPVSNETYEMMPEPEPKMNQNENVSPLAFDSMIGVEGFDYADVGDMKSVEQVPSQQAGIPLGPGDMTQPMMDDQFNAYKLADPASFSSTSAIIGKPKPGIDPIRGDLNIMPNLNPNATFQPSVTTALEKSTRGALASMTDVVQPENTVSSVVAQHAMQREAGYQYDENDELILNLDESVPGAVEAQAILRAKVKAWKEEKARQEAGISGRQFMARTEKSNKVGPRSDYDSLQKVKQFMLKRPAPAF
jgi:hypothetical protein